MSYCESYKHHLAKQVLAEWLSQPEPLEPLDLQPGGTTAMEYPVVADSTFHSLREAWAVVPDYLGCRAQGHQPLAFIDVVYLENGVPKYGFEIYHRHRVPNYKRDRLRQVAGPFKIYEIRADWILNQIRRPDRLRIHRDLLAEEPPGLLQQWGNWLKKWLSGE